MVGYRQSESDHRSVSMLEVMKPVKSNAANSKAVRSNPVRSRRAEYAALTHTAVLDAARLLFVQDGYEATSMDDIARSSRVSKGAVYYHFDDKQQLFAELFRSAQEAALRAAVEAASRPGEPWHRVEAATDAFLASYLADEEARSLLRQSLPVLGVERRRAIDEEIALPFIGAMLEELRDRGEIRPVPIAVTARVVFSVLCEAAGTIASAPEPEVTFDEVRVVVGLLLSGLRASP
jgi:AcrR family transcriptional regulator